MSTAALDAERAQSSFRQTGSRYDEGGDVES